MTDNIAERVLDRWRGENLSLKSLLSPDEISRYFEFLGVTPSSELLNAYSILSRFDEDENGR